MAIFLRNFPIDSTSIALSLLISAFHFSAAEASKKIQYQEFWEASFLGHEMDVWIEESDDPKTAWFSVKSEKPDTLSFIKNSSHLIAGAAASAFCPTVAAYRAVSLGRETGTLTFHVECLNSPKKYGNKNFNIINRIKPNT